VTQPAEPRQDASADRPAPARTPPPAAPARQRWRLVVAVPAPGGHGAAEPAAEPAAGRSWPALLAASGLPLAGEGAGRGRVSPAAPLPLGVAGEREVVDFYLSTRLPAAEVRRAMAAALPSGASLVDLRDVWVGAPSAPAAVVAADYRVLLAGPPRWRLEGAVLALLGAAALPRERRREKKASVYDLRPLILGLEVRSSDGGGATLAMRLRHAPDAVGRPDEVVAALGEPPASLGETPTIRSIVRERVVMADDADAPRAR
jgi:radical SAM-linked protein